MGSTPLSPRLIKGAIVALDPFNLLASVIIFQYNPAELSRSLSPQASALPETDTPRDVQRLTGPPRESISLSVTVDAADQLAVGDPLAAQLGVYPQLAALEMILYPKSALVLANAALAALGTLEIEPPQAPLTLFVWGAQRVVPVRLESYDVQEQYHDPNLNPILAQVNLSLRVLTYADFARGQAGYSLFLAYQLSKEAAATLGSIGDLGAVAGGTARVV